MHANRTSKRLHRLVCDREVWVCLLQGIDSFSKEKVEELARFGSNGSPEVKAEVVKAAGRKMKPSDRMYRISIRVSVTGWGGATDTFEVDGDALRELTTRGAHLTLTKVASMVGSSFTIQEVHCSKSISNVSAELILARCAEHVKQQADKMDYLELTSLPRGCAPNGARKELFFTLLKLSRSWEIKHLDWFPHGSYLAGLSGDTNIGAGNILLLTMDRGLQSVKLNDLKKLWSISLQANIPHFFFSIPFSLMYS